jgi:gliding motility-associated-like protein
MCVNKIIVLLLVIFTPLITAGQILQEGCEVAGFGVDADCYANGLQYGEDSTSTSNSDDWFLDNTIYTGAGIGVIDTTGTSVIKTALQANINLAFPRPMAFPSNTVINNIRYMDATYTRDFYGGSGATDYSSFTIAAKNGEDPSTWSTGPNNVTPKTDLIDCYGHLRRDGLTTSGPLWLFLGFSRVSNSGSSFFDAELFAETITYDGVNGFSSAGPDEGHKAWEFDNLGNITEIGDLAVSTEFSTTAEPIIELRIWVSRVDYNNISSVSFNFGTQFDGSSNSSLYGYADVIPFNPNVGCGLSNPDNTVAPPWGTLNSGGGYSTFYEKYQFAEFGINLTAFGIDPADLVDIDACDTPFSSILYKSRASASFTSSLKDFNGPINFKDIPEVPVIATTDTLDCYEPIGILTILDTLEGSFYEWQTPDGNIISNPYSSIIQVDQPGTYIAFGAPMQGCDQMDSDTVYVPSNIIVIDAYIESDTVWDCAIGTNLYGFPNGFGYNWTGPSAYSSTAQQVNVSESGIYILEVYDLFSGCNEFDTIYVVDYPCEHLISTTLPPGIDITIMLDTILPTFTVPTDLTIACDDDPTDLNLTGEVTDEADECDPFIGEATYADVIIYTCEGEATILRTWSLTDGCGNEATAIQTIILDDWTPPNFTIPEDVTIECNENIDDLNLTGEAIDESDNCDNFIGQATYQDSVSANDLCTGGYLVYRIWSLADACGNDSLAIQVITLEDTTPPSFTAPADVTIECDLDPNDLTLTEDVIDENDNCGLPIGEATYTDIISDGVPCIGGQIITRTWLLADACGNTATAVQVITLEDTTAPTFTTPADVTIECDLDPDDLLFTGEVTDEFDDCDTSLGQATYTDVISANDPCVGATVITRTWTLTDDCGNSTSSIQIITLEDTTAPTFTTPVDVTIECDLDPDDLLFTGEVIDESDNCDISLGQATYTDVISADDPCVGAAVITRTWILTDDCGNSSSSVQVITLEDTTAPTFTTPVDLTIECDLDPNDLTNTGEVTDESDNCDRSIGQASYTDVVNVGDPCAGSFIITRTWTLSDDCGNNVTTVQVITFEDTTAPTFTLPADVTLECDQDPNDLNFTGDVINENDNCNNPIGEATYADSIIINAPCDGAIIILRTWTLSDACGNTNTGLQTIILEDTTPPLFTVPEDVTLECDQDPNDLTITGEVSNESDNCDSPVGEATYTDNVIVNAPCDGAMMITRTWMLSDDCGNITTAIQMITLEDTTPPVFTQPADITLECDQDVNDLSFTGDVTNESDNCDSPVGEATYADSISINVCIYTISIKRTWTLTDDCGNSTEGVQIITLEDTTAPEFSAPADVTIECDEDTTDLNLTGEVTDENDNCDTSIGEAIYSDQAFLGDLCSGGHYILRTWTLTDACGNDTSIVQTITFEDTTPPVFTSLPGNPTIECDSTIAIPEIGIDIFVTDNCDDSLDVVFSETITEGSCANTFLITRTWVATDNCGNQDSISQMVNFEDTNNPVIISFPENIIIECSDSIPNANLEVIDNCDSDIEVNISDNVIGGPCPSTYTIERTYTWLDNCGNQNSYLQTILVEDTTPPFFTGPEDVTIECDQNPDDLILTGEVIDEADNCDTSIGEATYTDQISPDDPCIGAQVVTRTWTLADACGNIFTGIQIIIMEDSTPPSFSVPDDITLECDIDPDDLNFTGGVTDESDNCDTSLGQATYTDVISNDDPCIGALVITRTWTLSDACGNDSTGVQIITLEDTTPPNFTIPGDITLECDIDPDDLNFTGEVIDENDNCDTSLGQATYTDVISNDDPCTGALVITRTWTLSDACGNDSTGVQMITLEDTTPPNFTIPGDITLECDIDPDDLNFTGGVTDESDNCDNSIGEAGYTDIINADDPCTGMLIIYRTWILIDGCGNETNGVQIITLEDTTPPNFTIPADITLECDIDPDDLNFTGGVTDESDNCDTSLGQATYTDVISNDDPCIGALVITRTWILSDACGNDSTGVQIITLEDTTPPNFTIPDDITLECDIDPDDLNFTGGVTDETDNCDTSLGQATYTDVISNDDPCIGALVITRTWILSDACGNDSTGVQIISLLDTTAPTFTLPGDITLDCDANPNDLNFTGDITDETDNCDNTIGEAVYTDSISNNDPCAGGIVISRTWTLTDACGNIASGIQVITLVDTTSPTFTVPADITLECDIDPDDLNFTGDVTDENDNCDSSIGEASYTDIINADDPCTGMLIIYRTWILIDGCGNETNGVQIITLEDTTPPNFTIPGDITLVCDADPTDLIFTGDVTDETDNCDYSIGEATYFDAISNNDPCEGALIITRTWTLSDACGNDSMGVQIITLIDTIAPVLIGVPIDVTVNCDAVPMPPEVTTIDACDSTVDVDFIEVITDGACLDYYTIIRTWTATDNCGNTATESQEILVQNCGADATILISPDSTICENEWVTFTASVTSEYDLPNYQWQFSNDGNTWMDILGEINSSYSFQATINDIGWYQVIVANNSSDFGDSLCYIISNQIPLDVLLNTMPTTVVAFICEGTFYTIGNSTYSEAGDYTEIFVAENGCDSLVNLHIEVLAFYSISVSDSICSGEIYEVGNSVYTENGNYVDTLQSTGGCDSIINLNLFVFPLNTVSFSEEICEGDSVNIGNSNYTETGVYTDTLQSSNGCDSIIVLDLTVHPHQLTNLNYEICEGDSVIIGSSVYMDSGSYTDSLQSSEGCDSIVQLNLEVFPVHAILQNAQICTGDSYGVGNSVYTTSGTYVDVFTNSFGCDSIVTTNLIVSDQLNSTMNAVICFGDSLQVSNAIFTESGTYFDTLIAGGGCDSIVTINLIVLNEIQTARVEEICEGNVVAIGDSSYYQTGIYTTILTGTNGCDSTVVLDLLVHPDKDTLLIINDCEGSSYSMGGQIYEETGVYSTTLSTVYGCDSIVTLELNLLGEIGYNLEASICDTEEYVLNNISYNETGVYTQTLIAQAGCDSIINLSLTVLESVEIFNKIVICESDSAWIFDQYQNIPGTYTQNFVAQNGCDSLVTIELILEPEVELFADDEVICEGESVQLFVDGASNVVWSPPYGLSCTDCPDPIASPGSTTTYTVSTESCLGAMVYTEITVEVNYPPVLEISADISLLKGDSALLEVGVNDLSAEIIWTTSYGDTLCVGCYEMLVQPDFSTSYIVTAISSDGCIDQEEVDIEIRDECREGEILIPNFITPNGDGSNDRLEIRYSGVKEVSLLRIYNRWGELVFETKNVDTHFWNGKFLDRELNPGVYVYYLEVYCLNNELFIYKGNVTIIK